MWPKGTVGFRVYVIAEIKMRYLDEWLRPPHGPSRTESQM